MSTSTARSMRSEGSPPIRFPSTTTSQHASRCPKGHRLGPVQRPVGAQAVFAMSEARTSPSASAAPSAAAPREAPRRPDMAPLAFADVQSAFGEKNRLLMENQLHAARNRARRCASLPAPPAPPCSRGAASHGPASRQARFAPGRLPDPDRGAPPLVFRRSAPAKRGDEPSPRRGDSLAAHGKDLHGLSYQGRAAGTPDFRANTRACELPRRIVDRRRAFDLRDHCEPPHVADGNRRSARRTPPASAGDDMSNGTDGDLHGLRRSGGSLHFAAIISIRVRRHNTPLRSGDGHDFLAA